MRAYNRIYSSIVFNIIIYIANLYLKFTSRQHVWISYYVFLQTINLTYIVGYKIVIKIDLIL